MNRSIKNIGRGFASLGNFFGETSSSLPKTSPHHGNALQSDWQKINKDLQTAINTKGMNGDAISEWKQVIERRRSKENQDLHNEIADRKRGQYFAFVLSLFMFSTATYFTILGQVALPIAIITGNIALVAGNLLWQRLANRR